MSEPSTPRTHYTPAAYTLQRDVTILWNLLLELAANDLTHTYTVVFGFFEHGNIDYPEL